MIDSLLLNLLILPENIVISTARPAFRQRYGLSGFAKMNWVPSAPEHHLALAVLQLLASLHIGIFFFDIGLEDHCEAPSYRALNS
jgi:hypothetical protein